MSNIYRTINHANDWKGLPQYEVKDNKIFRTVSHRDG